ncbi:glycosyltransferase family 4 protein [Parafrankia elaeagni]|uniref:glycosyltransferase family 4 protein n=1 Tax=Parafrankia elaeagni TaxID=222534 RepID=UPI001E65D6F0|nr:glycosyltransferase family 4 protein [Parafrankia elaeagni]
MPEPQDAAGADAGRQPRGRVLIIVQNLPVRIDRRVWQEAQSLIRAGYVVSVICPRGPKERRYQVVDGVHIWTYRGAPATTGLASYAFEFGYCWLRTFFLSFAAARKPGFDVIQACNPPDTYWALALFHRLFRKKFVFDHHDLCPEVYQSRFRRDNDLLYRLLLVLERGNQRFANHVLVTNESYRRIALTRGRRPPEDVTVVRSGPDLAKMQPVPPRPELRRGRPHMAAYLGVMGPQDGVDGLVEAIDHYVHVLGRTDCHFVLMGFGDCLADLKTQVGRLGLQEWVEFTGRADDTMIKDYLSSSDVGLSPDPRSPLNEVSTMNKTLEYMAFGLPVVAFDLTETRVSAGEAAVYATTDEPSAFARALAELIDDPERRSKLGTIGRERIENELSWRHSARQYVGVYDRLLGRSVARDSGVSGRTSAS